MILRTCMFIYAAINESKASPCAVLALSFLPHTKMQFVTADGTSDPSCQVQCLQQWPVPGVCMVLDTKDKLLLRPCSSDPVCYWHTQRQCSGQILACCRSSLHLQSQDSPLGDVWEQHMHEVREFQRQKASVELKECLQEGSAAEDSPGHLPPPQPDHHSQQESLMWRMSPILV